MILETYDVEGYKFTLNKSHYIAERFRKTGDWDAVGRNLILNHVEEGMSVVDVGANAGYYSLVLSKAVGENGVVYAYEPYLPTYRLLILNIEQNGIKNIEPHNIALSNTNDEVEYICDGVNVRTSKSMRYDESFRPAVVDFIKIDADGAEIPVLEGMAGSILNNNNSKIEMYIEYDEGHYKKYGYSKRDLDVVLELLGFKVAFVLIGRQSSNLWCVRGE